MSSGTIKFVLRRVAYSAVVLLGVIVVTFSLIQVVPGDPVRIALGTRYSPESYAALREASGLDRSLPTQVFDYLGGVLTGDLGVSFRTGQTVTSTLMERFPATLSLAAFGLVVGLTIALVAGVWAALHEGTVSDAIVRIGSQFGVSVPDFWMGLLLITVFAAKLGWFPSSGYVPLTENPAEWLKHLVLPGLTVGVVAGAIMTRYIRSAVLEVVSMGYVRTARSKGMPPRVVTLRHIVRNSLIPILTISGIQFATILGGVIVVEVVFAWPGLGNLVFSAVQARDYPLIQGAILLIAVIFLVVNFLVDVLYAVVDPRIRLS
ncbi:ABC transporter permease [Nocardioides sp.]|uniref:ABC transporter permease n=1 Tax=Nocardioides sp. TaxID=35761 RepID=UPI003528C18C